MGFLNDTKTRQRNREYLKEWRARQEREKERRKKARVVNLASYREKRYGLSPEKFEALKEEQQQRCLICQDSLTEKAVIDHNHQTGEVRGILCSRCNVGLGLFQDSPAILASAIEYLSGRSYGRSETCNSLMPIESIA